MRRPVRRLRRHLVVAFTAFTVLVAAVFGLYAVVFMYAVEDSVFEAQLAREAAVQLATHAVGGDWRAPADTGIVLYRDPARFPADLKPGFAQEPWRSEFSGREGRHYHVRQLQPPAPAAPAWLVAEVSRQLVVRPIRDRVVMVLACTALVMVLLAIWLGVWLARRGTRPLYRLVHRVETLPVQPQGGSALASEFADDEIGVLARALDRLSQRVSAFVAREHAFTRDASHELRTPLAVISSAAGQLLGETGLSERGHQHVQHIRLSALQLQQAVAALLALAGRSRWLEFGADDTIFSEGQAASSCLLVCAGSLQGLRYTADGGDKVFGHVGAGGWLSVSSLFEAVPRHLHSVRARTDGNGCLLNGEAFRQLCLNDARFACRVMAHSASLIRHHTDQIDWLTSSSAEERLAEYILRAGKPQGSQPVVLPLSHSQIAVKLALRAMDSITADQLVELTELNADLRAAVDASDAAAIEQCEFEFHRLINRAAGGAKLAWFLFGAIRYTPARLYATDPGWGELAVSSHDALIEAFEKHDREQVDAQMSLQFSDGAARLLAHLDNIGIWD